MNDAPKVTPVKQSERISILDITRGFALLGILLMNIQSFGMIGAHYMHPHAEGQLTGHNYWIWYVNYVFGDMKFMNIFSMLFGAGMAMMAERQKAKGLGSVGLHYRRMFWLLIFGLMHGYLIWYGDVLYTYAVCGMVLYWLRRLPVWALFGLGILTLGVGSGLMLLSGLSYPHWPPEQIAEMEANWTPPLEEVEKELNTFRGSWLDQMPKRAAVAFAMQSFFLLLFMGWRAGGLMLLGMALYKSGVLTGKRSNAFYRNLALLPIIGVPIVMYGVYQNDVHDWSAQYGMFIGLQYNYWAGILVSLGYIGILNLIINQKMWTWLTQSLANVGQMAFTNYISQSVICTLIFYGHGLGQFGRFDRTGLMATVVGVWAFQLVFSNIWLRYFRFGPLEWLWRSLSYWRRQPFLRSTAVVTQPNS